jgi:hypothetical protein
VHVLSCVWRVSWLLSVCAFCAPLRRGFAFAFMAWHRLASSFVSMGRMLICARQERRKLGQERVSAAKTFPRCASVAPGLKWAERPAIIGRMKTTIDIPPGELKAVVKNTGAKSGAAAVLMAVKEFNRRRKLAALADRLKGSLPNFMTLEDLKAMREDAKWEAAK